MTNNQISRWALAFFIADLLFQFTVTCSLFNAQPKAPAPSFREPAPSAGR